MLRGEHHLCSAPIGADSPRARAQTRHEHPLDPRPTLSLSQTLIPVRDLDKETPHAIIHEIAIPSGVVWGTHRGNDGHGRCAPGIVPWACGILWERCDRARARGSISRPALAKRGLDVVREVREVVRFPRESARKNQIISKGYRFYLVWSGLRLLADGVR